MAVFKNRPVFQKQKMNEPGRDWFFLVGVTTLFSQLVGSFEKIAVCSSLSAASLGHFQRNPLCIMNSYQFTAP